MELLLRDGDYVPDGQGGLTGLQGAEEILQRVLFRLQARRGALPFLPELGSQLYRLLREKPSARQALAERYAIQALEPEENVKVDGVVLEPEGECLVLTVYVQWQGEPMTAQVIL